MSKQILLFIVFFFFSCYAIEETLYIAAWDKDTKTLGQAYSSSGGNFWQTYIKNKGMIGEAASGLRGCRGINTTQLLNTKMNATQITQVIREKCGSWTSYRLTINTFSGKGDLVGYIAARGCHSGNQNCGMKKSKRFVIMGGGLRPGVLEAGEKKWKELDQKKSLKCRLYETLAEVYRVGGEKVPFKGASIATDSKKEDKLFFVKAHDRTRGNNFLLSEITKQMPSECFKHAAVKSK
eukprot:gene2217-2391_t